MSLHFPGFSPFLILLMTLSMVTSMVSASPIEIVGHRGASAQAPENTLASIREGWKQGADAVEIDVWLTADKRVVLMHDQELKRTTGAPGLITQSTWAELRELDAGSWKGAIWAGEPLPLLEQALKTIPADKRMFVEIKSGVEIVPHVVPIIRDSGKAPSQIVIISFSQDVCAAMKAELPEHVVLRLAGFKQNEETGEFTPTIESLIEQAKAANLDGLNLSWKGPHTPESARLIKDAGLSFSIWTVNTPETAQEMAKLGAQTITTDHPGAIRGWLGEAPAAQAAE
jgi:glycerophosphoryl diester phosphodiesterase